ncbi:MAG: hybrid sensor histidine kinase/response regulator [Chloroflexi bacterium]|nr:hybrid sensor histidine kinase/response regulator [Chloroflexota bacterium]
MTTILVIDDDAAGGKLVSRYLQRAGYTVVVRTDGRSGLERALAAPPDLILLDVMMPGMDGYAVCRHLRADPTTRETPVIFLSARGELADRVAGLDEGAVDYLVKPFVPDDLLARARAALRTKALQDELRQANATLMRVERSRQEFVSMLTHDIRGMLGAVGAAIEMCQSDIDPDALPDAARFLEIAERNTQELTELATNLLDCYRLDEGRLRPRFEHVEMGEVASEVIEQLSAQAERRHILLTLDGRLAGTVIGDPDLLRRVLQNLVTNALKFVPPGGSVQVVVGASVTAPGEIEGPSEGLVVAVVDDGPGVASADQAKLFERFSQVAQRGSHRTVGSGLGLSFARQVVEMHGGAIWVESTPGQGSTFAFILPLSDAHAQPAVELRPLRAAV